MIIKRQRQIIEEKSFKPIDDLQTP